MKRRRIAAASGGGAALLLAVSVVWIRAVAQASGSPSDGIIAAPIALSAPSAPASLQASQAATTAASEFNIDLSQHAYTTRYGSFTDTSYHRLVNGVYASVGTLDAWVVTVQGINFPMSCASAPPPGQTCPVAHTMEIVIDDETGTYLEAVAY